MTASNGASKSDVIVRFSWGVLAVCIVGWPTTALTVWSNQPQGVMALSWIAIILTAVQTLLTAYVKREVDDDD